MLNIFDIMRPVIDPFIKHRFLALESHNMQRMHAISIDEKLSKVIEYKDWCKRVSNSYKYKQIIERLGNNFNRYYYSSAVKKYTSSNLILHWKKDVYDIDCYDNQVRVTINDLISEIDSFFDEFGSFDEIIGKFNEVYSCAKSYGIKAEKIEFDFYDWDNLFGLTDEEWKIYEKTYRHYDAVCRPNINRWSYKENGWTKENHEVYCLLHHLAIICAQVCRFKLACTEHETPGILCTSDMRSDWEFKRILKKIQRSHDDNGSYDKVYDNVVLKFSKELKEDEEHEKKILETCDKFLKETT